MWAVGVCRWGLGCVCWLCVEGNTVVCGVQRATAWRGSKGPPKLRGAQLWLSLSVRLAAL